MAGWRFYIYKRYPQALTLYYREGNGTGIKDTAGMAQHEAGKRSDRALEAKQSVKSCN